MATPNRATPLRHCDPVLDTGIGNLVAAATAVRRRAINLIEIATSPCSLQSQIKVGTREYVALIDTTPVGLYHECVVVLHGELAVPYTLNPP